MKNMIKRICALLITFGLVAGLVPATVVMEMGAMIVNATEVAKDNELNNGFIKVTVSDKGGFGIRTVEGDKLNKSDNDKYLVFEYDDDNTSFTSFQVTRNGETKEYIFGGTYPGSSKVSVSKEEGELKAVWSVDDLTFTQTISLVETGSNEHGSAQISYSVKNTGEPAQIKCRILMDTALGYWDYAYYNIGGSKYVEKETALEKDGYNKSFFAANNTGDPSIVAYSINASIDDVECKPYRTVFAHWNNLASTVFDYDIDETMTFTNAYNVQYMTSDSAYALYFDMGKVAKNGSSAVATNYGIYSNENVDEKSSMAVNLVAPDVMKFPVDANGKEDQSTYENGGKFTVKTYIDNFSGTSYTDIRIVVYTTGGVEALDDALVPTGNTYEEPYSVNINGFPAGEQKELTWNFQVSPREMGQYAKIHYKIYDVSDEATLNTGVIMNENLLGEGSCYVLCPGSVEKIPVIKFTGSSPDAVYTSGIRNLFITGDNFSILEGELAARAFSLQLSRVDGFAINGNARVTIPSELIAIDTATNVMTVTMTDDTPGALAEGMYQLTVDYTDPTKTDFSGQALRFQVSNEEKYKNDSYGFLAVIRDDWNENHYFIQHFKSAEEYWEEVEAGRVIREDVLLEFAGSFIKEKQTDSNKTVYTGVSLSDSHNIMTLNGCLDIRNGSVTVSEKKGSVTVDFDAELYTTGSGTHVWTGMCALTELEAGTNYELVPYDEDGNRLNMEGQTITLLWPSVGQGFQSLMGLLFELKYGELGIIKHANAPTKQGAETRLVAFGAAFDLSFLIPDTANVVDTRRAGSTKSILGSSWDAADHNSISFSPEEIRALNKRANYRSDTANTNATKEDVAMGQMADLSVDGTSGFNAASIVIDDILFGGEYLGVNLAVGLGLPPYITGLPALEVLLAVRTVGDWAFGVEGQCHFSSFTMEATIEIMSKDNIPIPNTLRFFVGGITPGINVDGVGVLWLQGGGGGIENLYDTVFLTDSVPPLKLIIEAQFSVLQIFTARASLGLSLRGIDVRLTNGRMNSTTNEETGTIIEVKPVTINGAVQVDWYPEFYMLGVLNLDLATIVQGGGYVVADAKGFYEFFIRAAISVPSDIPIIGGITVTEVGMGVNDVKVWGAARFLNQSIALSYYWGGGIDWNSGSMVYPTYPELVGMDSQALAVMPLSYDEETAQTLYMAVGTNVTMTANSTWTMGRGSTGIPDEIKTDVSTASTHTVKLAESGAGKLLVIQWSAESEAAAKAAVQNDLRIMDDTGLVQYPVVLLDNTKAADSAANAQANTNLTYDPESKTASLAISFTEASSDLIYSTTWKIVTPMGSQLVVYDVAALPEIKLGEQDVSVTEDGKITLNLSGTMLEEFDCLTVFAEATDSSESKLLGRVENPFANGSAVTFQLPADLHSGAYDLQVVATDEKSQFYSEAETIFLYNNPNQPQTLASNAISATNSGDYKVDVTIADTNTDAFDGYVFTAYDRDGNPVSGVSDVVLYKDGTSLTYNEDGTIAPGSGKPVTSFTLGGQYVYTQTNPETGENETVVIGFAAGDYTIQVRRWKRLSDGIEMITSAPVQVSVTVKEPVDTKLTVAASASARGNTKMVTMTRGDGVTYELPAVTSGNVRLDITSSGETVIGKWRLDGGTREGTSGTVVTAAKSIQLNFSKLEDGVHVFNFMGENEYGDAVAATYQFVVDTIGPRLLLAEPVNGSLFDYWTGKLTISGVTDKDALLTVVDNTTGKTLVSNVKASGVMDSTGTFTTTVKLDRTILSHDLTIIVRDNLGNETAKDVTVQSNGLGSIEQLLIYNGSRDVTNTKLTAGGTYDLRLMAKLKRPETADAGDEDLYILINTPGMVDWVQTVEAGESEMKDSANGVLLTASAGAEGMITARFLVNDTGAWTVSMAFGVDDQWEKYVITQGDGAVWTLAQDKDLSFTTDGPASALTEIRLNGQLLDSDHYAVSENTVITLKESFLNTLTEGQYTINIVFENGDALGTFRVEVKETVPTEPEETTDSTEATKPSSGGSADTADGFPLVPLSLLMFSSMCAGMALLLIDRRKRGHRS